MLRVKLPCDKKVAAHRKAYCSAVSPQTQATPESANERFGPIRKGLLEFLILKIVEADQVYVADMLRKLAGTEFATQEGTLYPLLSRMRREGLVDYEWKESEAGPPRKYYELTAKGRAQLAELTAYWDTINKTIDSLGK